MNELLELVRGPYDIWNVIGGVIGGGFGVVEYLMVRRHFMVTLPREAKGDAEKLEAARVVWLKIRPLIVASGVLLALGGFFAFGSILRQ